jgi:hypothetical protein
MPKLSWESGQQNDYGPVVEVEQDVDDYSMSIVQFRQDIDATPLLKGLPGDSCHCHHWGYVIKGRLTFRTADGEEVFEAGDAFYLTPGHIPVANEPGTQYVQFSPKEPLAEVSATIMRNMEAMQAAQA